MKKYTVKIPLNISLPLVIEAESREQAYYQAWNEMEIIQKAALVGFEALKGLVESFSRSQMFKMEEIDLFVEEHCVEIKAEECLESEQEVVIDE